MSVKWVPFSQLREGMTISGCAISLKQTKNTEGDGWSDWNPTKITARWMTETSKSRYNQFFKVDDWVEENPEWGEYSL